MDTMHGNDNGNGERVATETAEAEASSVIERATTALHAMKPTPTTMREAMHQWLQPPKTAQRQTLQDMEPSNEVCGGTDNPASSGDKEEKGQCTGAEDDKPALLRTIEDQIKLRWAMLEWAGVELFSKTYARQFRHRKRKKREQKRLKKQGVNLSRMTPSACVIRDVVDWLLQAVFALDPQTPMLHFLKQCIPAPKPMQGSGFETLIEGVWEALDVPNPYTLVVDSVLVLSPPAKPKRSVSNAGQLKVEPAYKENNPNRAVETGFLSSNISLTSQNRRRKPNSLLVETSNHRRVVASHFNTRLSNIQSLFQHVPVRQPPQPKSGQTKPIHKRRPLVASASATTKPERRPTVVPGSTQSNQPAPSLTIPATPAPKRRRVTLTDQTPQTPSLRPHFKSNTAMAPTRNTIQETPLPLLTNMRPSVARAGMALVPSSRPSTSLFRRTVTSTNATTAAAPSSLGFQHNASAPASSLVQQAFSALQDQRVRRHRRSGT